MDKQRRDKGDGSIYFRESDQRWVARYVHSPGSKPKVLYAKTEQEAKKKLRDYKKEIAKNDFVEVRKETVESYMTRWFNEVKLNDLKPKSQDGLEATLRNYIFPYIGDIQIASITANDIQSMINQLVKKDFSHSTIKKAYDATNSCFKLGIIKDEIIKNPCLGARVPKSRGRKKGDIRFLTQEEMEMVCKESVVRYGNDKLKHRLGYAVIFLLYSGLRVGELMGLQWRNIDYVNKTINVRESVVVAKDRTRKDGDATPVYKLIEQDTVKTSSSERIVHLNKKAIAALKELQTITGQFAHVMSSKNGTIIVPRNFDRTLRSIAEQCGVRPFGAHVLRHTYASMLFKNNVDVKTISELLGHADVSVTYNTYIHLIKEQKQQAVDILDNL